MLAATPIPIMWAVLFGRRSLLDDTGRPFTIYVKMCGPQRLWPRLTDIVTGQVFKSLAVREWEGLDRLSQIGLRVAQRMALFEEGLFWRRSAIVVREVPPPASLSEMVCSGLWAKLSLTDRHAIFDAIARIIDRIHAAGFACAESRLGTFIRNAWQLGDGSSG